MAKSKNKVEQFSKISIHENIITIEGRVIQIRNICRMTAYEIKWNKFIKIMSFILFLVSSYSAYMVTSLATKYAGYQNNDLNGNIIFAIIMFMLFMFFMFHIRHGVQIQTNGGTSDILITNGQPKAEELLAKIAFIIDNIKSGQSLTINEKMEVINGDQVMGSKFDSVRNTVNFSGEQS